MVGHGFGSRPAWVEITNNAYTYTDDALYLIVLLVFLDLKFQEEVAGL